LGLYVDNEVLHYDVAYAPHRIIESFRKLFWYWISWL